VLALGTILFDEPLFKLSSHVATMPEELLWITGEEGVRAFQALPDVNENGSSEAFKDAGTYILRDRDLYLLFNASGNGLLGRGSHGHNDALSVEVSACGTSFIVDPGTYVYSADLQARHLFRSVAAHSTLEIDGIEQNTTDPGLPFVIGDEAHPRVLRWETTKERDIIVAEHDGYKRLADGVTHRRTVRFEKPDRLWMIEDSLYGAGEHDLCFRFHFAEGLELSLEDVGRVCARDKMTGARFFILALDLMDALAFEPRFVSRDYGEKSASASALWTVRANAPCSFRWALVPVCAGEDESKRLSLIEKFRT
jgi:hypothetical protein